MVDQGTQPHRFEVTPTAGSHFGWLSTRLSRRAHPHVVGADVGVADRLRLHDRAVLRTPARIEGVAPALRPQAPRYLGLALIAAGVVALLISTWQYRKMVRYLWSKEFEPVAGVGDVVAMTPLYAVAIALIFIGLFAFGAVFIRAV